MTGDERNMAVSEYLLESADIDLDSGLTELSELLFLLDGKGDAAYDLFDAARKKINEARMRLNQCLKED